MPIQRKPDVLTHAQAVEESAVLEQHPDATPHGVDLLGRRTGHVRTEDAYAPPVRLDQPHDVLQEDALAGAGRTDHRGGLSTREDEVDPVEHHEVAKPLVHALQDDGSIVMHITFHKAPARRGRC